MQRAWGASPAVGVIGVALALLTCGFRLEPRPDTLSHAFLAVTDRPHGWRLLARPRLRWLVPLVLAAWVNVHGYFVNGLLVLLAAAVAATLGDRTPGMNPRGREAVTARDRWVLLGLGAAACFLHPQGWRATLGPIEQILLSRDPEYHRAVQELQPSLELFAGAGLAQWLVLGLPFAVALGVGASTAGRSAVVRQGLALAAATPWIFWPPARMDALEFRVTVALFVMATVELPTALRERRLLGPMLLVGFTILAVPMVRNLPLLTPAALILVAPAWTAAARALLADRPDPWSRRLALASVFAFAIAVAWLRLSDRMNTVVRAPSRTGWGIEADRFPAGATDFIAHARLPGLLLNTFDVGGYLLYRLHPERRVFIAGNTSMYPLAFFEWYLRHVTGPELALDTLVRERVATTRRDRCHFAGDRAIADPDHGEPQLAAGLPRSCGRGLHRERHRAAVGARATRRRAARGRALSSDAPELARRQGPLVPQRQSPPRSLQTIGRPDLALAAVDQLLARRADGGPRGPGRHRRDSERSHHRPRRLARRRARAIPRIGGAERKLVFFAYAYEVLQPLLNRRALPEAERHLRRMIELQPDACGPYTGLGKVALLGGYEARARAMLAGVGAP